MCGCWADFLVYVCLRLFVFGSLFACCWFCGAKACHVLVSCVRIAVLKNRRLAQLVRAPR